MEIPDIFKTHIAKNHNNVVLELGAGEGDTSQAILNLLAGTKTPFKFHFFEPNIELVPEIIEKTKYFLNSFPDVHLFNEGISMVSGRIMFYKAEKPNSFLSSTRQPKLITTQHPETVFTESQVDGISLDDHMQRSGLRNTAVDFIFMDMQGAEVDLIRGASNTLLNTKYIFTKYSNTELYNGQGSIHKIFKTLRGFDIISHFEGAVLLKNKHITI